MSIKIKSAILDFRATDYKKKSRRVEILESIPRITKPSLDGDQRVDKNVFIQRWYLSLQGDDTPQLSAMNAKSHEPLFYRYDWAFGITPLGGHYWDWQKELEEDSALSLQLILQRKGENVPEAFPASATLSVLYPSRNTQTVQEKILPALIKTGAKVADAGAHIVPAMKFLSAGFHVESNILESSTAKKKNWFLYQFLDEKYCCPVVEWRVNKRVLKEFGPLLRGTLYLAFYGTGQLNAGSIRLMFRPQIRYCSEGDLDFIVPTSELREDEQMFIDITARSAIG